MSTELEQKWRAEFEAMCFITTGWHSTHVDCARLGYLAACRARHAEAPLCAEHSGKCGTRSGCPYCALQKLQAAISAIDLAFDPNEMGCSGYDVHLNEDAVVERVSKHIAEAEALRVENARMREEPHAN